MITTAIIYGIAGIFIGCIGGTFIGMGVQAREILKDLITEDIDREREELRIHQEAVVKLTKEILRVIAAAKEGER